jgi:hypothetical protein
VLTIAPQILVDSIPTTKLSLESVATVNCHIACTIKCIKAAVAAWPIGDQAVKAS